MGISRSHRACYALGCLTYARLLDFVLAWNPPRQGPARDDTWQSTWRDMLSIPPVAKTSYYFWMHLFEGSSCLWVATFFRLRHVAVFVRVVLIAVTTPKTTTVLQTGHDMNMLASPRVMPLGDGQLKMHCPIDTSSSDWNNRIEFVAPRCHGVLGPLCVSRLWSFLPFFSFRTRISLLSRA